MACGRFRPGIHRHRSLSRRHDRGDNARRLERRGLRHDETIDWDVREAGSTWPGPNGSGLCRHPWRHAGGRQPPVHRARSCPRTPRARRAASTVNRPCVVGGISSWNPRCTSPVPSGALALEIGNTVMLNPARGTPITGGLPLAKIYEEAGLPPMTRWSPSRCRGSSRSPAPLRWARGSRRNASIKKVGLELGGSGPVARRTRCRQLRRRVSGAGAHHRGERATHSSRITSVASRGCLCCLGGCSARLRSRRLRRRLSRRRLRRAAHPGAPQGRR
ncbi:MAG: aldehyde dehydrogenase family protein [Sciscionella sp.]